jgi:hypothetical protein
MRVHTHREYLLWELWLEKQWNQPSRTDHYLMLIAQQVSQVFKKSTTSRVKDFLMKFTVPKKVKPLTRKEAAKIQKAAWFGRLQIEDKNDGK